MPPHLAKAFLIVSTVAWAGVPELAVHAQPSLLSITGHSFQPGPSGAQTSLAQTERASPPATPAAPATGNEQAKNESDTGQKDQQPTATAVKEVPAAAKVGIAVGDAGKGVGGAVGESATGVVGGTIQKIHSPSKTDHVRAVVVFCCIITFMLIIGSIMGCVLYIVLRFLQPKRPKTEEEAKEIIDNLKKQRAELLEKDQELQAKVSTVQSKMLATQKAKRDAEAASNPASESAAPPERVTRRESINRTPFLNPDGTYTMPDWSQLAESERLRSIQDAFAPIIDKKDAVKEAILERKDVAVKKAHDILVSELKEAYEDVREASIQTSNPTNILLGVADLPPIALLLAGMCVPMQLKSLLWFTMFDLIIKTILCILTFIALSTEYGVKCLSVMKDSGLHQWIMGEATGEVGKRHWVYPWMEVDAASLLVQILIRFAIMRLVNLTLQEVDESNEEHAKVPESDNILEAFQHLVDHALSSCGTTMLCYDRVVSSWPFWFLNFVAFFDFSWQIYGLTFLFNTPNYECEATMIRTVFRIRAVTFMLFLTWHVAVILNAAMSMMVQSKSFTDTVVSLARKFDEDFSPPWLPICTILVRAFFARNQTDLDKMELRILRAQKRKLEHRQRLSMKRQEDLKKQQETLDEQLKTIAEKQRLTMNSGDGDLQSQFLEEHRKKIESIFSKVDLVMKTVKENQARANSAETSLLQGAARGAEQAMEAAAAVTEQAQAFSESLPKRPSMPGSSSSSTD